MKYKITRAFIVYQNGHKDTLENEIETNDLETERDRLTAQFNCKTVYFTFTEKSYGPVH